MDDLAPGGCNNSCTEGLCICRADRVEHGSDGVTGGSLDLLNNIRIFVVEDGGCAQRGHKVVVPLGGGGDDLVSCEGGELDGELPHGCYEMV